MFVSALVWKVVWRPQSQIPLEYSTQPMSKQLFDLMFVSALVQKVNWGPRSQILFHCAENVMRFESGGERRNHTAKRRAL